MKIRQSASQAINAGNEPAISLASFARARLCFLDHALIDNKMSGELAPLLVHLTLSGIRQYLLNTPSHSPRETANCYQTWLEAENNSAIQQEIILCAFFNALDDVHLETALNAIFQEKLEKYCTIKTILGKLQPHLKQRCMAVAGEFNLKGQDIITRLFQLMENLNFCAQNSQESPLVCLGKIQDLATQMSLTTLSDLLPPQVSEYQKLEDLMSDHLPQLHQLGGINKLTWNILTQNYFIGFADASGEQSAIETQAAYKKRLQNIAAYLIKISSHFKLNIIALQESYSDLCEYLPENFKKNWTILIDKHWKMILYKKQVWTQDDSIVLANKLKTQFEKQGIRTVLPTDFQGLVLTHNKTQKKIVIYNVYTQHEDEPDNLEKAIHAIRQLHQEDKDLLNIPNLYILGDFNRRLPDCGIYARDNATHLVPPMFRTAFTPRKLYDYTDCCFELNPKGFRQKNGTLLDTLHPAKVFTRPLVSLRHALKDNQYTRVIFPDLHQIRLINEEKSLFGEISLAAFTTRLEQRSQQKILALQASKNRFSVMSLDITFETANPLLDALGISCNNNVYHFIVVPQTADHARQEHALKLQARHLTILQMINEFGNIVDLFLPE